MYNYTIKTMH